MSGLAFMSVIAGVLLLLSGEKYVSIAIEPGTFSTLTPIGWGIVFLIAFIGVFCMTTFQDQLEGMGYQF
jgi:uncharacterized membrane protein YgdD (TMEM256/DUF423 family)